MKIIADTHIFYYLGQDAGLYDKVSAEPVGYVNLFLSHKGLIIWKDLLEEKLF
jgi:hypothetical protein